jgi:hypothetical protein
MVAMMMARPDVALGVVFATSVASLSLAAGAIVFLSPPAALPVWARRTWPMVLPTALLAFLAGFRGEFTLTHAGIFLLEGIVVAALWNDPNRESPGERDVPVAAVPRRKFSPLRTIQLLLAIALALIGGWAAVHGAAVGSGATRTNYTDVEVATAGLLAATILSPLLILPMLGTGVDLAHRGQAWIALSSQVGVVLLNLCLLLPLVIVEGHSHALRQGVQAVRVIVNPEARANPIAPARTTRPATVPTTAQAATSDNPDEQAIATPKTVPLPLAVWRVDIVALIALGLFLLPPALGRWPLDKLQGLGLIVGYIAYLLLAMVLGVRVI